MEPLAAVRDPTRPPPAPKRPIAAAPAAADLRSVRRELRVMPSSQEALCPGDTYEEALGTGSPVPPTSAFLRRERSDRAVRLVPCREPRPVLVSRASADSPCRGVKEEGHESQAIPTDRWRDPRGPRSRRTVAGIHQGKYAVVLSRHRRERRAHRPWPGRHRSGVHGSREHVRDRVELSRRRNDSGRPAWTAALTFR